MYLARAVPASSCGCDRLGNYPDYGGGGTTYYYDPMSSGPWGSPGGSPLPHAPGGSSLPYSSALNWGGVWDTIQQIGGDVAADLASDVAAWLEERIGRELWDAMPERSKQEAVRTAIAERTGISSSSMPWIIAGVLGAVVLLGGRR